MGGVGFDSKQFRRGRIIVFQENGKNVRKYMGFNSHLGIGVIVNDQAKFAEKYVAKTKELAESFGIEPLLPLYSSTHVKQTIGLRKAIAFADQLISGIQNDIDSVHCSFLILPPKKFTHITVGGFRSPSKQVPINQFIEIIGPMFSYLVAYSFIWENKYDVSDLEFRIDSFRSKETEAWETIIKTTTPNVYIKGDECDPLISCADMLAFLTDAKLYDQKLKLEPNDIKKAWVGYSFPISARFLDDKTLNMYSWKNDDMIDISRYIVRPTVFLLVDEVEKPEYAELSEDNLSEDIGVKDETEIDLDMPVKRKFHNVIKRSDVYYSAIKYAYQKNGSLKIFHRHEDMSMIRDGDVLVYVGANSKKVATTFKDAWDVEILSGLELRNKIKGVL